MLRRALRRPQPHRPLLPLLALVLASAEIPVVLHGGDPMPIKYGVTLAELFAALGIEWGGLSLATLQQRLSAHHLALTHQPDHFPAAERLLPVRDEIGKRPPWPAWNCSGPPTAATIYW